MSGSSIAFIDSSAHPAAIPYYGSFPNEPIPPAGGTDTVLIDRKVNDIKHRRTELLLETIIKTVKPGGSILIVSHGNDAGPFLSIGDTKSRVLLQSNALAAIRSNADGKLSDADTAKMLIMSDANFVKFKALVAAVQKLELDRVDLRACNVGKNEVTLSRLQVFFNCNKFCAPKIYDAFGAMQFGVPTSDNNSWTKWFNDHKGAQLKGAPPDRFAWKAVYAESKTGKKIGIEALAESKKAISDWASAYLPNGNYSGGPLFYHAFTDEVSTPIFAGESGFRGLLAEAYKGKEPSRTIDVNTITLPPP